MIIDYIFKFGLFRFGNGFEVTGLSLACEHLFWFMVWTAQVLQEKANLLLSFWDRTSSHLVDLPVLLEIGWLQARTQSQNMLMDYENFSLSNSTTEPPEYATGQTKFKIRIAIHRKNICSMCDYGNQTFGISLMLKSCAEILLEWPMVEGWIS